MSFNDLETRRRHLMAEISDPRTSPERLEQVLDEAQELRRQIYRQSARDALSGAHLPGRSGAGAASMRPVDGAGWGTRFASSAALDEYRARGLKGTSSAVEFTDYIPPAPHEIRALLSGGDGVYTGTGAGAFQRPPLQPWVATLNPDRIPRVLDIIDRNTTENSSVDYIQDTSAAGGLGGVAAETLEGIIKPEATGTFTQKTAPVRTIPHYLPITRQALEDNKMLRGYVDGRLRYGLLRRADYQALNGDGTGANLTGILNTGGIGTYAPGAAEARLISLRKARTIAELTELEPTAIVVNPSDWEKIDLLTAAGSGEFMAGPGGALVVAGAAGVPQSGAPLGGQYPATVSALDGRLWGMVVVVSTAIAAGTALIGNFREGATLWDREQTQVYVSDSHADFFIRNTLVLLAEARMALTVQQPKCFVRVTFNGVS